MFWQFNMLTVNFPKYFDDCTDCTFHKFCTDLVDCAVCVYYAIHNFFADYYFSR